MSIEFEFAFRMDGSVFALLREDGLLKPSRWTGKSWEPASFGPADVLSEDAERLSEKELKALGAL